MSDTAEGVSAKPETVDLCSKHELRTKHPLLMFGNIDMEMKNEHPSNDKKENTENTENEENKENEQNKTYFVIGFSDTKQLRFYSLETGKHIKKQLEQNESDTTQNIILNNEPYKAEHTLYMDSCAACYNEETKALTIQDNALNTVYDLSQNNDHEGFWCKIKFFFSLLNKEYRVQQLLDFYGELAKERNKSLDELSNKVKELYNSGGTPKDIFDENWKHCQRKKLSEDDIKILQDSIEIRNSFYKLIVPTIDLLDDYYIKSNKICRALLRWNTIFNKQTPLTENDKKILKHGLKMLQELKHVDAGNLKQEWINFQSKCTTNVTKLNQLKQKWKKKVEKAKDIEGVCNKVAIASGIVGNIALIAAAMVSFVPALTVPVVAGIVLWASGGLSSVGGIGTWGFGYFNWKSKKNIKEKVDNLSKDPARAKDISDSVVSLLRTQGRLQGELPEDDLLDAIFEHFNKQERDNINDIIAQFSQFKSKLDKMIKELVKMQESMQ